MLLGCASPRVTPLSPVVLQGQWIERDHCTITSARGVVMLRPARGARCTVNGREVTSSCRLTQGRTAHSPVYAGMSGGPAPFSGTRPEGSVKQALRMEPPASAPRDLKIS